VLPHSASRAKALQQAMFDAYQLPQLTHDNYKDALALAGISKADPTENLSSANKANSIVERYNTIVMPLLHGCSSWRCLSKKPESVGFTRFDEAYRSLNS
jgi:hypothetical protein